MNNKEILPDGDYILKQLSINPSTIKDIKPRSKRSHYRAIVNWLSKYKIQLSDSNIEQIRGYLESFYHLGELEDWEKASFILLTKFESFNNQTIINQLHLWGNYKHKISLFQKLLGKINQEYDALCLRNLATSYFLLGQISESVEYINTSLKLAQQNQDIDNILQSLYVIISIYFSLEKYQETAHYCERWLQLQQSHDYDNLQQKSEILAVLRGVNFLLSNNNVDRNNYSQEYHLSFEMMDKNSQINFLNTEGNVYFLLHQYDPALLKYQQGWQIAKSINKYPAGLLQNIGKTFVKLKKYTEALDFLVLSLEASINNGIIVAQANSHYQLANLYNLMKKYPLALEHCQKALIIAKKLEISLVQECKSLLQEIINNDRN